MLMMINPITPWLRDQLKARSWTHRELARRAGISQTAVSTVISNQRKPGWDFCAAIAGPLDQPPEKLMRLAGLLPPLPEPVQDEQEALQILRLMPDPLRPIAMKILRALNSHADLPLGIEALEANEPEPKPDPYLEAVGELWDQTPDWLKKSFTAQLRIAIEEYEREMEKRASAPPDEAGVDDETTPPEL